MRRTILARTTVGLPAAGPAGWRGGAAGTPSQRRVSVGSCTTAARTTPLDAAHVPWAVETKARGRGAVEDRSVSVGSGGGGLRRGRRGGSRLRESEWKPGIGVVLRWLEGGAGLAR